MTLLTRLTDHIRNFRCAGCGELHDANDVEVFQDDGGRIFAGDCIPSRGHRYEELISDLKAFCAPRGISVALFRAWIASRSDLLPMERAILTIAAARLALARLERDRGTTA